MEHYDLIVIGAGLNGCSIALDAASRGLKTRIIDKRGAGAGTSTLIPLLNQGFRHTEFLEFGLARRSLVEARILRQRAGFLCRNRPAFIPFTQTDERTKRRTLGLYNWLTRLTPQAHAFRGASSDAAGIHLNTQLCDSRALLVATLQLAVEQGCDCRFQQEIVLVERTEGNWLITCEDYQGARHDVSASAIVNASGVGALALSESLFTYQSRCVAQKHQRCFFSCEYDPHSSLPPHGAELLLLTDSQNRQISLIPDPGSNCGNQWLIGGLPGTTSDKQLTEADQIKNLLDLNRLLDTYRLPPVEPDRIQTAFMVPHIDFLGPSMTSSMDYLLELICPDGKHPLLNVIGGPSMNARYLAEQAINSLSDYLPHTPHCHTASLRLPEVDFSDQYSSL